MGATWGVPAGARIKGWGVKYIRETVRHARLRGQASRLPCHTAPTFLVTGHAWHTAGAHGHPGDVVGTRWRARCRRAGTLAGGECVPIERERGEHSRWFGYCRRSGWARGSAPRSTAVGRSYYQLTSTLAGWHALYARLTAQDSSGAQVYPLQAHVPPSVSTVAGREGECLSLYVSSLCSLSPCPLSGHLGGHAPLAPPASHADAPTGRTRARTGTRQGRRASRGALWLGFCAPYGCPPNWVHNSWIYFLEMGCAVSKQL